MVPTLLPTNTSDSLVINKKVDACCKVHDHCEHYIPRWKTKYHLVNWRPFTISSCECDHKFLKCLQQDDSLSAKDIKRIYFDILGINWCLNKILTFVPSKILAYKALCFVWYYTSMKIIFLCSYKKIYINSQHTQNKNTSREGETSWIKLKGKHRQPQFENHKRSIIKFVVHKFDKRIFKRKRFFFRFLFNCVSHGWYFLMLQILLWAYEITQMKSEHDKKYLTLQKKTCFDLLIMKKKLYKIQRATNQYKTV